MRHSPWVIAASIVAALSPLSAFAAHVNDADLSRPRGPLLDPDRAWSLPYDGDAGGDYSARALMQVMLDASSDGDDAPALSRLEDPILLPGALQAATVAMTRARREAQAPSPDAAQRPRTEALTQEQLAILSLIGLGVLILAGSSVALIARAPGGFGGAGRG